MRFNEIVRIIHRIVDRNYYYYHHHSTTTTTAAAATTTTTTAAAAAAAATVSYFNTSKILKSKKWSREKLEWTQSG